MIIEVMVTGDEKVEFLFFLFYQKVVGLSLDFMATLWGHGNVFFGDEKLIKILVFKMLLRPLQGPNSYIKSRNGSKLPRDGSFAIF